MNLVACIKQVPDTTDVKIDPETNTLIRSGVESITNPYDLVAVQAAVDLKEKYGGTVTVISMGPPQAEQVLREALSLGADRAVLLSDRAFAGADTLATSYTLSRAIDKLREDGAIDMVICGKQAIDGDTAQVGPGIAARLGCTQLTYVTEIREVDPAGRHVTVRRKIESGSELISGPLPAVLTVELELTKIKRASLPRLIGSLQASITVWNGEAIHAEPQRLGLKGSPTWVRKIFSPPVKKGGPKFDAREDARQAVEGCVTTLLEDPAYALQLLKRWEV